MQNRVPIVYLAGAMSVSKESRTIRDRLEARLPCKILLPNESVRCPKAMEAHQWAMVFSICKQLMDASDCVVVNLRHLGKDTAAEIGYCYGLNKPIIGFGIECTQDTIIRGFLHSVAHDEIELIKTLTMLLAGPQAH